MMIVLRWFSSLQLLIVCDSGYSSTYELSHIVEASALSRVQYHGDDGMSWTYLKDDSEVAASEFCKARLTHNKPRYRGERLVGIHCSHGFPGRCSDFDGVP